MNAGDKIYFDDDGHPVAVDEIDFAAMDGRLAGKPVKDGERIFDDETFQKAVAKAVKCGHESNPLNVLSRLLWRRNCRGGWQDGNLASSNRQSR